MVADRYIGIGFFVLGIAMIWSMSQMEYPELGLGDPGPRLVPMALGIVIALLGAVLAVRRPVHPKVETEEAEENSGAVIVPPEPLPLRIVHLVNLAAYVLVFEALGYGLSTFIFLGIAIFLLGARNLRGAIIAVIAALIATATIGVTLVVVANVVLPRGILF